MSANVPKEHKNKATRNNQQTTHNKKQHTTHQTTNNKQQHTMLQSTTQQSTINNTANHKSYERTVNNFPTVRQRILRRKQSNHNQENVNALQEETKIGMNIKIFEATTLSL